MRYFFIALIGIGLSGCAIPIPLQIASWAASGLSYVTTGKSMSDHAVSAVASQDCAVHRIVLGLSMCEAYVDESEAIVLAQVKEVPVSAENPDNAAKRLRDSMVSLAEKLDDDLQPASGPAVPDIGNRRGFDTITEASSKASDTVENALVAMTNTIASLQKPEKADTRAVFDERDMARHYLIIGQFPQIQQAEALQTRHASLQTVVRMVLDDGALLFQVTAGPFSRPDAVDISATIASKGISPEIALLCADRATRAPCGNPSNDEIVQLSRQPRPGN